jgi:chemotaxis protein CheX
MTARLHSGVVRLAAVLDVDAAAPLAARLLALRGTSPQIDASRVVHLGGLCLQVLLSARATWAADGLPFTVTGRSAAFDEALTLFGAAELTSPQGADA